MKMKFLIPAPSYAVEFTPTQLIFTLSYKSDTLIFFLTAVGGIRLRVNIHPSNKKHLTLDDRIYIRNELYKGTSFKDIARFLCN